MTEAIVGLVGVVVGGLLTGGVAFVLERRREKRGACVARRVVESELQAATKAVADALSGGGWPPGWHTVSWLESWSTYRPLLAVTMDDEAFAKLGKAYLYMGLLQTGLAAGKREFAGQDEAFLTEVDSCLSEAVPLLADHR